MQALATGSSKQSLKITRASRCCVVGDDDVDEGGDDDGDDDSVGEQDDADVG